MQPRSHRSGAGQFDRTALKAAGGLTAILALSGCLQQPTTQLAAEVSRAGAAVGSAHLAVQQYEAGRLSLPTARTAIRDARTEVGGVLDGLATQGDGSDAATQALSLAQTAANELGEVAAALNERPPRIPASASSLPKLAADLTSLQERLGRPR